MAGRPLADFTLQTRLIGRIRSDRPGTHPMKSLVKVVPQPNVGLVTLRNARCTPIMFDPMSLNGFGVSPEFVSDRKSVGWGKSVSVRVDLGGRRIIKKKKHKIHTQQNMDSNNNNNKA